MRHEPRKKIRLPRDVYGVEGSVWLVSVPTWNRTPLFRNPAFADMAQEEMQRQHNRRGTRVLVYCIMPDHVHGLVQVRQMDLLRIVGSYKSYVSGRLHDAGYEGEVWQQRFHDRGIRQSVNMDDVITYVVGNPVEEGLVAAWHEWRWTGGELIEPDPPT